MTQTNLFIREYFSIPDFTITNDSGQYSLQEYNEQDSNEHFYLSHSYSAIQPYQHPVSEGTVQELLYNDKDNSANLQTISILTDEQIDVNIIVTEPQTYRMFRSMFPEAARLGLPTYPESYRYLIRMTLPSGINNIVWDQDQGINFTDPTVNDSHGLIHIWVTPHNEHNTLMYRSVLPVHSDTNTLSHYRPILPFRVLPGLLHSRLAAPTTLGIISTKGQPLTLIRLSQLALGIDGIQHLHLRRKRPDLTQTHNHFLTVVTHPHYAR